VTLQELMMRLHTFWQEQDCILEHPYDVEKGAGTFNPSTFFRVLGPEPWRVAYVEPSRRPTDGRYGDNPFRTEKHYQYQVILKPSPLDSQEIYLASLLRLGLDLSSHDLKFTEDDWESPTLGATGLGWQVELDGMEITQFTYFQQMGGIELDPISVELTYGLERIAMLLQGANSFYDLYWSSSVKYAELRRVAEREHSTHNFELADIQIQKDLFCIYEREGHRLLDKGCLMPAYDFLLKCSHSFNILDARGALGVAERTHFIARIRDMARRSAKLFLEQRQDVAYPLLPVEP